jgi:hypothetical protein
MVRTFGLMVVVLVSAVGIWLLIGAGLMVLQLVGIGGAD